MKNKIFAVLFTLLAFYGFTANAQYEKGDNLLNLGLNLADTYGDGTFGVGGSYEIGVHEYISAGGQVDFNNWNDRLLGYKWSYNFLSLAARASYHFGKHFIENDKLDLYGGPAVGYRIVNYKTPNGYGGVYNGSFGNGIFVGAFVGGRYYFKPNLGVFTELGYNAAALKVGVSFKM